MATGLMAKAQEKLEHLKDSESVEKEEIALEVTDEVSSFSATTYLIFFIKGHRYAIKTLDVKEIMYATKIHAIPFVPNYVEGVINCHGTPYTVVNVLKLNEEENSEISESTFLVLNREDDHFSIHISNIEVFFEPDEDDVLEDRIKYKHQVVPFFDDDAIEKALLTDLR